VNDPVEIVDGTNPTDASSYNSLNKGLVAYYPFNGNAKDESGYGNDGVLTGANLSTNRFGISNSSVRFSQNPSYMTAPGGALPIGQQAKTLSLWLKAETLSGLLPAVVSFGGVNSAGNSFGIGYGPNLSGSGAYFWGHFVDVTGTSQISSNVWCQLVATFDGTGSVLLYQNAQFVGAIRSSGLNTTSSGLYVGRWRPEDYSGFVSQLNGQIDDIRIYNRALTSAEVGQLYQEEVGSLDSDGDGLTDAWERGYGRYQLVNTVLGWDQAKIEAESIGGHLATITTAEEWQTILNVLGGSFYSAKPQIWIGGRLQGSNWVWDTAEIWQYTRWASGEPNSGFTGRVEMVNNNGLWNDTGSADAGYQIAGRAAYLLEYGYPTDPTLADTDGDGFDDRSESLAGTDPNNASVYPEAGVLGNSLYIRVYGPDWDQAEQKAGQFGGHLV
jgi:hypothetical protein